MVKKFLVEKNFGNMKRTLQKYLYIYIGVFWFTILPLSALEISFKLTPSAVIPLGFKEAIATGPAYGGVLNADINLFNFLSVGPEVSFFYMQKEGETSELFDFGVGASAGVFYSPLSRLMLSANGSFGMNFAPYNYEGRLGADGINYMEGREPKSFVMNNFYYRFTGDASFRFTPNFTMGVTAGYTDYLFNSEQSLFSGIQVGVSGKYVFETKRRPNKLEVDVLQEECIYPLFSFAYKSNPFAYAYITNRNNAEIKNVKVSFRAEKYTSSAYECETIPVLKKNKSVEIPLFADFSNELSSFSENGQFPAELVIEYTLLGKKYTEVQEVVIDVYRRNAFTWADPAAIVSLISPNDSSVLELSKSVIGIARDNTHTGISQNLEFSMALFESLNSCGIIYEKDSQTPYAENHFDFETIDSVQFPFQTINYKSGDSDDLAVLFSAMLNSVGIKSALIFMENDVIVGVDLKLSGKSASKQFSSLERLISIENKIFLPLSMNALSQGYYEAWNMALAELDGAENYDIVIPDTAWVMYQPLGVSEKSTVHIPNAEDLNQRISEAFKNYQKSELIPLGKELVKQYKAEPTDENGNAVGMAYLRMGNNKQAKNWFGKGAEHNNLSSLANIGNILLMEKDFDEAEKYFNKVLSLKPDHAGALQGLERVKNQRGN